MKYRDPSTGNFKDLYFKVSDTLPIGFVGEWGGSTAPEGWLICDGSAVSRTIYSALFAAIGTTYGTGNGSTTFNLPDYRGRVGVGKSSDTEFDTLGETGGEKTHTLTTQEIPSHSHNIKWDNEGTSSPGSGAGVLVKAPTETTSYQYSTASTGGGQPHNILQPYLVTNYIIKAYQVVAAPAKVGDLFPVGKVEIFFDNDDHSNYLGFTWERIAQGRTLVGIDSTDTAFDTIGETGGAKTHTLTENEMPAHNHGEYLNDNYGNRMPYALSYGGGVEVETGYYVSTGYVSLATNNRNVVTAGAGGSQPHNNLQPYIVVAYWKRVS